MSGPEFNPRDEEPVDREEWEAWEAEVKKKVCQCNCHKRGQVKPCFYCANAHNFEGLISPSKRRSSYEMG